MPNTFELRRQHDDAERLAMDLLDLTCRYRGPDDALPISVQLTKLCRALRLHLIEEDEYLYPALIAAGDQHAREVAVAFQREMGAIAEDMEELVIRWSSSALIAGNIIQFRRDLARMLATTKIRVEREEAILYPLANQLLGSQPLSKRAA